MTALGHREGCWCYACFAKLERENAELRADRDGYRHNRTEEEERAIRAEDLLAQVTEALWQLPGNIALRVAEIPRDSPEDQPEMMLVTRSEMVGITSIEVEALVEALLSSAPSTVGAQAPLSAEDRLLSAENVVRHFAPMFCKHCQDWIQTIIGTIWPTIEPAFCDHCGCVLVSHPDGKACQATVGAQAPRVYLGSTPAEVAESFRKEREQHIAEFRATVGAQMVDVDCRQPECGGFHERAVGAQEKPQASTRLVAHKLSDLTCGLSGPHRADRCKLDSPPGPAGQDKTREEPCPKCLERGSKCMDCGWAID